jgi:hypothetical protein
MHSAPCPGHVVAGRYRLLDEIGRGAMGIVWRGRDELLDRDVAIKQILLSPLTSATQAQASYQRTLREARSAARLSHPGVVTVFDVVEEEGSPWIVMELVRARPLDQVIAEDGPLPPARAAQLGLDLLDALNTAHEAGVLHRDVKPSNVLISPDGKAVLTDFGIATIAGDPGMTQAGMVVGTPGFSSPERVRGTAATPASDLWSLGATLYAAVEGRGPFDRAGGSAAIIASIATEPAPRAPSAGPLGPAIDALLRADPAQRPDAATTAEMLRQAWREARAPDRAGLASTGRGHAGQEPLGLADPVAGERSPAAAPQAPALARSEATTATQEVRVPAYQGESEHGWPDQPAGDSAGQDSMASKPQPAASTTDVRAAANAARATGVVPDLMATPNFAALQMPDAAPGELPQASGHGEGAGDSIGRDPAGGQEPARDRRFGSGFLRSKRGMAVVAPLAALAVAAGVIFLVLPPLGLPLYQLGGGSPAGTTMAADHVRKTSDPRGKGRPGTGGSGAHGTTAPSAGPSSGASGGKGKHKPGSHKPGKPSPSGSPSTSAKPSASGSPSTSPGSTPSASPSSTPAPSPSSTQPTLPPGFGWFAVTAADAGTNAGFEIGAPAAWQLNPGEKSVIKPVTGPTKLSVNMVPWSVGPVREARRLQAVAKAAGQYPGYALLSIASTRFDGWAAARWTFRWQPAGAASPTDVTELLFRAQTSNGPQEYILSVSAPAPRITWAAKVLRVAMRSFGPLPG